MFRDTSIFSQDAPARAAPKASPCTEDARAAGILPEKRRKYLFSGENPLLAVNRGVGLVQPSYLCVIRDLARHGFSADFGGCGACAGGCFGCLVGGFFVVVLVCFLGR